MKPELLIIGKITPRMAAAFDTAFICHHYDEIPDIDRFISGTGKAVQAIATTGHDGVPAPILTGLPDLKIISCYGVGYDAIDVGEAAKRSILVTHTPNVLNGEVATTSIMLLMACYRQLFVNYDYILSGDWMKKGEAPSPAPLMACLSVYWDMGALARPSPVNWKPLIAGFPIMPAQSAAIVRIAIMAT